MSKCFLIELNNARIDAITVHVIFTQSATILPLHVVKAAAICIAAATDSITRNKTVGLQNVLYLDVMADLERRHQLPQGHQCCTKLEIGKTSHG